MPVSSDSKNWADANAYCTNHAINGQTGWRLPTRDELSALYASGKMNGQGWTLYDTWSSTPNSNHFYYYVNLADGYVYANFDTSTVEVTCVR